MHLAFENVMLALVRQRLAITALGTSDELEKSKRQMNWISV